MNRLPATVGWASHAPVQINVARDLHIHGGGAASTFDVVDDCGRPRGMTSHGFVAGLLRLWSAVWLVVSAAWFVVKALFWVVVGVLALGTVLPALTLSLGLWILGRVADLLLLAECKLGGGPMRLAYLPTLQRSSHAGLGGLTGRVLDEGLEAKQLEARGGTASAHSTSLAVRGHDA